MPWSILSLVNFWVWPLLLMGLLALLWMLHLHFENASLADVGFCLAFLLLVVGCGLSSQGDLSRRILVMGMGSLYALRLGAHLMIHRVWNRPEDGRYGTFRQILGAWEPLGLFGYFQFQVPAALFFASLLCWIMAHQQGGLRWWDALGIAVYLLAITGESIADRQLERFRANPLNKGKTLRSGLWRYSRHPNYFFESLHWWAYVPMAVGLPWSWMAVIWPGLMMGALLWITGVPWAEAQAITSRGDDYRHYQRTTSLFIPWFPKKI